LIQGKSSANLSIEDVDNALNKMGKAFTKFLDRKHDELNDAVKSAIANAYDDLTDDKNVELVLFTNTTFDKKARKKISAIIGHETLKDRCFSELLLVK